MGDQSPHSIDAEDKENANDSVDDGGPLEVSALSVRDDGNSDENEGDDDEEMPPKITMEDLADDLDSTSEESFDHVTDSPEAKFKELSPRENSTAENAITEIYDRDRGEDICGELPKPPKDSRVGVEDTGSTLSEQGGKGSNYYGNGYSKQSKDKSDEASKTSSQRNWQARDYSPTERYLKSSYPYELDEDIIMMRAKAALRRANRYSPPKGLRGHFSDPHSLSLSDLSLNALSAWEPVHVSTPLIQPVTTSNDNNYYRNYADHVGYYSYKSTSGSHWHDIPDSLYDDESWLRRNVAERTAHHHSVSGKRLSPAVEEVIQQRKLQEKHGGRYAFSTPWRKPSSPLYHNKWQLSRTHPMSYVEWKALYWRPQREPGQRRERHWYHSDPYEPDLRRLSWPPKPTSSKLVYGSRPLSPPVTFPPAKVPRAIPEAYVSKMALPSYHNSSDSGYSDWQQSNSRWENTMRSRHSSLDYVGGAGYYLRQ